jgi:heme-binding protein
MPRKILKWTLVVAVLIFIGLQFTNPARTNPPIDHSKTLEATTTMPPEVSATFTRSCDDCHSNKTNWRWYTHIAPVSWFTVGHVNDGRKELNFSVWGNYRDRMKETRLRAICEQSEKGTMPLSSYTFVHRDTKLSPDQAKAICDWTKQEGQRLTRMKTEG